MATRDYYKLCKTVLSELERGIQLIARHFSLDSLSLKIKEALVDGAENLLEVSVRLEPLLSEGEAVSVTEEIRKIAS